MGVEDDPEDPRNMMMAFRCATRLFGICGECLEYEAVSKNPIIDNDFRGFCKPFNQKVLFFDGKCEEYYKPKKCSNCSHCVFVDAPEDDLCDEMDEPIERTDKACEFWELREEI